MTVAQTDVPKDQGTSGAQEFPEPHKAYDGDTGKDLEAGGQPKSVDGYPMPEGYPLPHATQPPRPPMTGAGMGGPAPGGYPGAQTPGNAPGGYPGAQAPGITAGGYPGPHRPGITPGGYGAQTQGNKPEQCCNIYWILAIVGLFTSIPVIIGSFLPMCMKPPFPTRCHRLGWYACVGLLIADIIIVIIASVVPTRTSYNNGYNSNPNVYYG